MAGVSTAALAAAVSNSGALGSLGIGAETPAGARRMIERTRSMTDAHFNINVFCHQPATSRDALELQWCERLRPEFARFDQVPPQQLTEIYTSFRADPAMLAVLVDTKPAVVSCHFGLPTVPQIDALRAAGIVLIATATNLEEARRIEAAGFDAVIAQGIEAGGHRGVFNTSAPDEGLTTLALTRLLVTSIDVPIIAAGGIMNGTAIAAALRLGAVAAQLGTAFIDCPESAADLSFRAALKSEAAYHTTMTAAISGRPARCLRNRFTRFAEQIEAHEVPDYPIAYDAAKALHAAAKAQGEFGYGAQWAGQGAPLLRSLPASQLIQALVSELAASSMAREQFI